MSPPVTKRDDEDDLPKPPVTPTVEVWRAMTPEARDRFLVEVVEAFDDPRLTSGDGCPHHLAKRRATDRLRRHFDAIHRVIYLAEELNVLYPGEPSFCPDVLAVLDVPQPEDDERMAWVVADEGRGIDFVMEVVYNGRRNKDLVRNVEFYARLGIPEYFVYDRKRQEIRGYRLVTPSARRYQRIVPQAGRHSSAVLGLDLAIENGKLEFFYGMAALFGTEDLVGRLQGMMHSLEAKAEQAESKADRALLSLQESLLTIAQARGLVVSAQDEERIRGCAEPEILQRWLVRAVTAASLDETLAEG